MNRIDQENCQQAAELLLEKGLLDADGLAYCWPYVAEHMRRIESGVDRESPSTYPADSSGT